MGWLSKIILNGVEMLIKDSTARTTSQSNWDAIHNNIWNGVPSNTPAIYYVSPSGDNDNTGLDIDHPLASITETYSRAVYPLAIRKNCVEIVVAGGVYNENVVIGSSDSDVQCNFILNGDVTIYGSLSIANSKCWIFAQYEASDPGHVIRIYGDNSTLNIRGEKTPLVITESGELYSNTPIYITSTGTDVKAGMDAFFGSKYYNSLSTNGLNISGTFTDGAVRCIDSELRGKFELTNANAPVSFYALDSIVQSMNDTEPQTILPHQNIFSGNYLTELE